MHILGEGLKIKKNERKFCRMSDIRSLFVNSDYKSRSISTVFEANTRAISLFFSISPNRAHNQISKRSERDVGQRKR